MIGILLVNLGTPKSPKPTDVYRYLVEFLTDPSVIDCHWLKRQWLVRGLIVPSRCKQSAQAYQAIWMQEGSPLLVHGRRVQQALQKILGKEFHVELSMRYQEPSIENGLDILLKNNIQQLIVLPLFPQSASATTGSVRKKVHRLLLRYPSFPKTNFVEHYETHPKLIDAFCTVSQKYVPNEYDHILFSFHGLPEKQIKKCDVVGCCRCNRDCCATLTNKNRNCYSAQCYATAQAISSRLNLSTDKYTVTFQSRLGKDPWLQPYTNTAITQLAQQSKKRILVFCPSFVCDCLETLYEIGTEYAAEFKHAGGKDLHLVEGLNDHPKWIETLRDIVHRAI